MNAIAHVSVDTSFTIALPNAAPEAGRASAAVSAHMYDAQSGMGAMQGSQIRVGSGTAPAPAAFSQLPNEVQQAAADVRLQAPRTPQARQAVLERPAARPQPSLSTSALYVSRPGGLATSFAVLETLVQHAKDAGTKLTREEIKGYVALGEHAVHALQQPSTEPAGQPGKPVVNTVNPPLVLSPNLETARGISWYVAACAAQQDMNQQVTGPGVMVNGKEVTDLTVKGAFVFKDPNNAIHNFLQSSPLCYSRISSHFHERSASDGKIGWRPEQRGIEDYDRRLPGQNGAMLFDKLKVKEAPGKEEMFLKFESTGYPEVSTSAQRVDDQGQGRGSRWQALGRKISHAMSFFLSLFAGALGVDRKEHVHKGLLKKPVHEPFMQVIRSAEKLGLATNASKHAEQAEKIGLPHLESTLAELKMAIGGLRELSNEHVALFHGLVEAQLAIVTVKAELGAQSDHLGIERRGAETHVDLKPPQVNREQAHKEFLSPGGTLENAQEVLEPYTPAVAGAHTIPAGVNITAVKDWNRNGIRVNDHFYPGQGKEGNVSSSTPGQPSTLEQGCHAFVQACGNNPVAAEWISRFAQQGMAMPLLDYLKNEPLGTVGKDWLIASGTQSFSISTLSSGSVEVRMDYHYQTSEDKPLFNTVDVLKKPLQLHAEASLDASVTLRFDDLASYTATQVPVPVISAPLTYTTSHFDAA